MVSLHFETSEQSYSEMNGCHLPLTLGKRLSKSSDPCNLSSNSSHLPAQLGRTSRPTTLNTKQYFSEIRNVWLVLDISIDSKIQRLAQLGHSVN